MSSFNSITTVNGKRCTLVRRSTLASSSAQSTTQETSPQIVSSAAQRQTSSTPVASSTSQPTSLVSTPSSSTTTIGALVPISPDPIVSEISQSIPSSSPSPTPSTTPSRSSSQTSFITSSRLRSRPLAATPVALTALPDTEFISTTKISTGTESTVVPNLTTSASATRSVGGVASSEPDNGVGSRNPTASGMDDDNQDPASPSDRSPTSSSDSSKAGMIAGIVVGVVVALLIGIAWLWWARRRRKRKERNRDSMSSGLIGSDTSHYSDDDATRDRPGVVSTMAEKFGRFKQGVMTLSATAILGRYRRDEEISEKPATAPEIEPKDPEQSKDMNAATTISTPSPVANKRPSLRARASRVVSSIPKPPFTGHHAQDSFDRRDWFDQAPPADVQPTLPRASMLMTGALPGLDGSDTRRQRSEDPFRDPSTTDIRLSDPFADPMLVPRWSQTLPPPSAFADAQSPSPRNVQNRDRDATPQSPRRPPSATYSPFPSPTRPSPVTPNRKRSSLPRTSAPSTASPQRQRQRQRPQQQQQQQPPPPLQPSSAPLNEPQDPKPEHLTSLFTASPVPNHSRNTSTVSNASSISHWRRSQASDVSALSDESSHRDTRATFNSTRSDPFDLETSGAAVSMNLDAVVSGRASLMKSETVKSVGATKDENGPVRGASVSRSRSKAGDGGKWAWRLRR